MNGSPDTTISRGAFTKSPDFNKKILVVDDESSILQTLRFNLERSGYAVVTASDGRSAVAMAQREQPDLV
ncbi:MAG: response regulator, partial [Candidatus Eremiobacteraeota bacterium]|nr:response regulator [Candidatus Eremiobacteraeota bacterium]